MTNQAQADFETLTNLRTEVQTAQALLLRCGGDFAKYDRLLALLNAARAIGGYEAYGDFCSAVCSEYNSRTGGRTSNNEFSINRAHCALLHAAFNSKQDMPSGTNLQATLDKLNALDALFERRNTTDICDRMYGRTSWATYYLPTNERVAGGLSNRGSLGS